MTLVVVALRTSLLENLGQAISVSVLFTCLAGVSGLAIGKLSGADLKQSFTLVIEFSCRNNAIAILVAVALLGRPDFTVFPVVVFLAQVPLMLGGIALVRRRARSAV